MLTGPERRPRWSANEKLAMVREMFEPDTASSLWGRPGAPQIVTKGLVAERRMVGGLLEERLRSANSSEPVRIDYPGYDAIAGQWCYVSIDARVPIPPMSASSFGRDAPDRITVRFEPLPRRRSHPDGREDCFEWNR